MEDWADFLHFSDDLFISRLFVKGGSFLADDLERVGDVRFDV